MKHTSATIITITLGIGALTACTTQPEPTPTPNTTAPTTTSTAPTPSNTSEPTPTPTESPTPTEPTLDTDQTAARDIVSQFFIVLDDLRKDPERPLQELADITTGETQRIFLDDVVQFREDNVVQVGNTAWVFVTVGDVVERDDQKTVVIEVCTDSADADVISQETGDSVLPADRGTAILWRIETLTENARWKVGDATSAPTEGCPA